MKIFSVCRGRILLGPTSMNLTVLPQIVTKLGFSKNGWLFSEKWRSSGPLKSKGGVIFRIGTPTHLSTTHLSRSRIKPLLCGLEAIAPDDPLNYIFFYEILQENFFVWNQFLIIIIMKINDKILTFFFIFMSKNWKMLKY